MTESDIFEPFERLIEIEITGERRKFPKIIRCCAAFSIFRWTRFPTAISAGTATAPTAGFGWKIPRKKNPFCRAERKSGKNENRSYQRRA
jgi:hypothetical protein